jgi:hypothetical protein
MKKLEKIWKISGIIMLISVIILVISLVISSLYPHLVIFEVLIWISTIIFSIALATNAVTHKKL